MVLILLISRAFDESLCSKNKGYVSWYVDTFLNWPFYSKNLPDHRQYTHARLLPSTKLSIGYRAKAWYIALTGALFIPPILFVLIPFSLCPRLASIFDVADLKTISAALTVLLGYIFILTFLYGTCWWNLKHRAIVLNELHSLYYLSPIPCFALTIWIIPATSNLSSHACLTDATWSIWSPG